MQTNYLSVLWRNSQDTLKKIKNKETQMPDHHTLTYKIGIMLEPK